MKRNIALCIAAAIPGANSTMLAVAPRTMNQLVTSRDCGTCPLLRASSSLRHDGSSVFWLSSVSSAMFDRYAPRANLLRHDDAEGLDEVVEKPLQYRIEGECEDDQPAGDLERQN